jgi:hypothetical protein
VVTFREQVADVESGAFPEDRHVVRIPPEEFDRFPGGLP